MNYQQLLEKLFAKRTRVVSKDEIKAIAQSLGHPERSYLTIHIAGTNGKGSVATKMAKTLEYAGYRVGLFTSPHIQNYSERIQVNGVEISENEILDKLPALLEQVPGLCFFDYTTFLAFQHFKEKKADVAVIEAGIGGLYDVTNVVSPIITIITSVALDHMDMLGSTLPEIAYQKAGIIKPHIPVVVGPKASFDIIKEKAKACQSPLIEVSCTSEDYNEVNQSIAAAALRRLEAHFVIPNEAFKKGIIAKPPCRFERIGRFVLDVAHNPEGFESLLKTWNLYHAGSPMVAIIGLSADKDLRRCLQMIARPADHLFLVQAEGSRAASLKTLTTILQEEGITHFTPCQTIEAAIRQALAYIQADILVCGSFYIMQHARQEILRLQIGQD